jgi:hypothetical protein
MVSINDLVVAIKTQKGKVKRTEDTTVAAVAEMEMIAD